MISLQDEDCVASEKTFENTSIAPPPFFLPFFLCFSLFWIFLSTVSSILTVSLSLILSIHRRKEEKSEEEKKRGDAFHNGRKTEMNVESIHDVLFQ